MSSTWPGEDGQRCPTGDPAPESPRFTTRTQGCGVSGPHPRGAHALHWLQAAGSGEKGEGGASGLLPAVRAWGERGGTVGVPWAGTEMWPNVRDARDRPHRRGQWGTRPAPLLGAPLPVPLAPCPFTPRPFTPCPLPDPFPSLHSPGQPPWRAADTAETRGQSLPQAEPRAGS